MSSEPDHAHEKGRARLRAYAPFAMGAAGFAVIFGAAYVNARIAAVAGLALALIVFVRAFYRSLK